MGVLLLPGNASLFLGWLQTPLMHLYDIRYCYTELKPKPTKSLTQRSIKKLGSAANGANVRKLRDTIRQHVMKRCKKPLESCHENETVSDLVRPLKDTCVQD